MNDIVHNRAPVTVPRVWRWFWHTVTDLGLAIGIVALAYLSTQWS